MRVQLSQKTPAALRRFQAAVGVGCVTGPHGPFPSNPGQFWKYSAPGLSSTQHLLGAIWPWLGDEKRQQALDAVRSWTCRERSRFHTSHIKDASQCGAA